jgi:Zn-dependent protease
MLAMVNLQSPIVWAVVLGWIMTVVLHELAHGIVGHLGGDYTVRERGGLTLNPFQYLDPMFSIVVPIFFLLSGGIPLPGGSTSIRHDLLRGRGWSSAVALAGPTTNFLLFLLFALPFHPRFGWIHPQFETEVTAPQLFMATMVVLQFLSVLINLIPIPPLDGFGAIRPWLAEEIRAKLSSPQANLIGILLLYFVILGPHGVIQRFYNLEDQTLAKLGFDEFTIGFFGDAFNKVLFSQ